MTGPESNDPHQEPTDAITHYLRRMAAGDKEAEERAYRLLMPELRRLAHLFIRRQGAHHMLQTTALVNEVYLKLMGYDTKEWASRRHFLALVVRAMRSILIDDARGRNRLKRLPPGQQITLQAIGAAEDPIDVIALFEALDELRQCDALAADVVSFRFFCGLTMPEIAETTTEALRTVERKWSVARAFLDDCLSQS